MNQDIYNIYENYKQIYVLEEGSMLDKIKAAIAATVILASGLQADDNRARMAKDKINKMSSQEITQTFPNTVKTVQQTNSETEQYRPKIDSVASLFLPWINAFGEIYNTKPEVKEQITNSVTTDLNNNKASENISSLLDVMGNLQKHSIPK